MALAGGLDLDAVADGLTDARPPSRWRMELHERADGTAVINDAYNANPESMAAALAVLHGIRERAGRRTDRRARGDARARRRRRGRPPARRRRRCDGRGRRTPHRRRDGRPHGGRRAGQAGWHGEAIVTAGRDEAVAWLRQNVSAGDVVLVKASRGAALELVAEALLDQPTGRHTCRREQHPMRAILLGGGLSLLISLIGTRYAIVVLARRGYGQEIRDDGPTTHHTKRGTPDHGRARHHPGHRRGLLRGQADHAADAHGLGDVAALPLRRARHRRLPRRLHQDQPPAQPRSAQSRQDDRPDRHRRGVRHPGALARARRRPRQDPGLPPHLLHPRLRGASRCRPSW